MKRAIKFRAWNRTRKEMLKSYAHFDKQGMVVGVFTYPDDEYIPLQYTGLKIHGQELYEGDIVEDVVAGGRYEIKGNDYLRLADVQAYPDAFIILGNRFENPELLKST
jgi:hypothetical protein